MNLQLLGKLISILPAQHGKDNSWKKQPIINQEKDKENLICFYIWNNKIDIDNLVIGDEQHVFFNAESKEYNDRWYTDLMA